LDRQIRTRLAGAKPSQGVRKRLSDGRGGLVIALA
jgi:hypothetical protein